MKKIELLAPAGNFEALQAAIKHGADAVYLSGKNFGARHFAKNFDEKELHEAIELAHQNSVAVHVTINTLIHDEEFFALEKFLKFLNQAKVDAILVQDLGVALLAKKVVPDLPLHASTQMTVNNLAGVKFLEEIGFSRIVLSRECSLAEIKRICAGKKESTEIEVFVHGALCVSYSGQCLFSSFLGGRSGNRGECAQPCRLPYELFQQKQPQKNLAKKKNILSPKDFCALPFLKELISYGVASLKIEGRMKPAEYVATVVNVYRRAIDGLSQPNDMQRLQKTFSRGLTSDYLTDTIGKNLLSDESSIKKQSSEKFEKLPKIIYSRNNFVLREKPKNADDFCKEFFKKCKLEKISPKLLVHVETLEQAKTALNSGADGILFGGDSYQHRLFLRDDFQKMADLVLSKEKILRWTTPRIVPEKNFVYIEKLFSDWVSMNCFKNIEGINFSSIGLAHHFKKTFGEKIFSEKLMQNDYSLSVFNAPTVSFLKNFGMQAVTLSPELTFAQIKTLCAYSEKNMLFECLAGGYLELMVSAFCVVNACAGSGPKKSCNHPCEQASYLLKDRMKKNFPIVTDGFCQMHLLNSVPLSTLPHVQKFLGIHRLRLEAKFFSLNEIKKSVTLYKHCLENDAVFDLPQENNFVTRGHYFHGV